MRKKHINYGVEHTELLKDLFAVNSDNDVVEIRNVQPANWITEQGVWKKQKALEPRMPYIRQARFITLTLDPKRYKNSEDAYEVGKRHLRQFFYDLDRLLGVEERTPYCWKLEFHENGYPHWHIIFLHYKKLPYELVNQAWGKGRTDVQMIKHTDFRYLFKYAAKTVSHIPPWALERKQIRFFQTSKGFLMPDAKASPRLNNTEKELVDEIRGMQEAYQRKESTLGQRIERWIRTLSISSNGFVGITDYHGWSYSQILFQAALIAQQILQRNQFLDVGITTNKIVTTKEKLCLILKI